MFVRTRPSLNFALPSLYSALLFLCLCFSVDSFSMFISVSLITDYAHLFLV